MFEYKIQQAWEKYREDFGLGRIALFICFFNTFLFFLSGLGFGEYQLRALYPVGIALFFFFIRSKVVRKGPLLLFIANAIPMILTILLNYYLVGELDRSAGGLGRMDANLAHFDQWLYGMKAADVFYFNLYPTGLLGRLFYDVLMLSYMTYYLLPFYGGILYYRSLPLHRKYKLGRYFSSMILYFSLNYLLYLSIPVTGPQFFLRGAFSDPLPFTSFGQLLWSMVKGGQTTFIDCFPSGHTGIALLVSIWLFKFNHPQRYFMAILSFLIICATLAMRFHYTLDLIFAFPLAWLCYRAAWILFPVEITPMHFRRE